MPSIDNPVIYLTFFSVDNKILYLKIANKNSFPTCLIEAFFYRIKNIYVLKIKLYLFYFN